MPIATAPDGVRIAYDVAGESGPVLALLHGSFGDRDQWRRAGYVDAFRMIARVVSIDARGRGESDAPHDQDRYGIERNAEDVLAVLDAIGADRATVWGHSMGGRTGFELAARHPDRVDALISTGASGLAYSPYAKALNEASWSLYDAGMRTAAEAVAANAEIPPWMVENWAAGDAAAIAASARANASWAGADDAMATLAAPVLLLAGASDPVLQEAVQTVERVPRCVLVELEECDHFTSFTRSAAPCALALEFLRDLWIPGDELSPGGDNPVEK